MRPALVTSIQLLAAAALGVGSAWLVLRSGSSFGDAAGVWRVSVGAGSADAGLYTRARVALGGLLALNRSETMYYVAETDSDGRALRSRCSYRVRGRPPAARWWSITAYAEDFFLFPDEGHRYSINGGTARLDSEGRFAFVSGPTPPAAPAAAAALAAPAEPSASAAAAASAAPAAPPASVAPAASATATAPATAAATTPPAASSAIPWLPTPGDRGLMFTLRVYNPSAGLATVPQALDPPRIERIGDC